MRCVILCGLLSVLCATSLASAAPTINVGSHDLLRQTPNQPIQVYVIPDPGGVQQVSGVNYNIQIGDGGPAAGGTLGPHFGILDLVTNTIFQNNNNAPPADSSIPQLLMGWMQTNSGTVPANGLLATFTIDTTGFDSGTWPLAMLNTLNGSTFFMDGVPVYPTITDGSITIIPEPSTLCLLAGAAVGLLACAWRRTRRA